MSLIEEKRRSSFTAGLRYMVLSGMFFSLMSFFVKLLGNGVSSNQVVFVRSAVTLVLSYWGLRKAGLQILGPGRFPMIVRGLSGFGALMCQYYAVMHLSLADATVLQYTSPVFTAILAAIVLGEPFGKGEIIGTVASLIGVTLIARPDFLFGDSHVSPALYAIGIALLGGLFSSFSYVAVRRMREVPGILIIFFFSLVSLVGSIPATLASGWNAPTPVQWVYLIFGVSLCAQLGQIYLTKGLHAEQAGRATSMSYLQIVFAAIWGAMFLAEFPSVFTITGALLIAAGTVVTARLKVPVAQDAVVDEAPEPDQIEDSELEPTHSEVPSM